MKQHKKLCHHEAGMSILTDQCWLRTWSVCLPNKHQQTPIICCNPDQKFRFSLVTFLFTKQSKEVIIVTLVYLLEVPPQIEVPLGKIADF